MDAFSSSDNYYLSSANSLESGPRTTKREERKRRETHSAGSLHGLGHDFSEFFCCLGGLNAFVCVCVFKKVKDFERGEFELALQKHVSFSLPAFFSPVFVFALFKP